MIPHEEALKKLIEGNLRFAQGKSIHPNLGNELRESLVGEQKPFAAILSCSDSRVPVEIIFDVGLGDVFVIRTAGHVLSKEVLGSIEYAVGSLGVKLVVILGHDNCGAVKSALNAYKHKKYHHLSENLKSILNHIFPVFDKLDKSSPDLLNEAIMSNIDYQVKDLLEKDPYLAKKNKKNEVRLTGAKYNLETGIVEFFN